MTNRGTMYSIERKASHPTSRILLFFVLIVSAVDCQKTTKSIDELIESVFGPKATETKTSSTTVASVVTEFTDEYYYGNGKCRTYFGETGECVPYYLCDADEREAIDNARGEPCPSYLDKCCPESRRSRKPDSTTSSDQLLDLAFGTMDTTIASKVTKESIIDPVFQDEKNHTNATTCHSYGQIGECVAYYLCDVISNQTVSSDTGMLDIRENNTCPSYLEVCCPKSRQRRDSDSITPSSPKEHIREGCGWRNPDGIGFLIKNDDPHIANFAEFPWVVGVLKKENEQGMYLGSGSLIHPSVVLTVAHFTIGKTLKVRAGEWDTQTKKEIYPYQERDVESVEVHKDFNKKTLFYDVAVLFLTKPMDLAPNVGVACLPPPREKAQPGTKCFSTGWGKDKFGAEGRYQAILQKSVLPVIDNDSCQKRLRSTRLGAKFQLHTSFMCAMPEGDNDVCRNEGGSPLVCPIEFEKDRYVQNGMVAWGIGCEDTPGVYVDIGGVRDWIDEKCAGKGYEPKTYSY